MSPTPSPTPLGTCSSILNGGIPHPKQPMCLHWVALPTSSPDVSLKNELNDSPAPEPSPGTEKDESLDDLLMRAIRRVNHAREELSLAESNLIGVIHLGQIIPHCGCCGREIKQGTRDWCMDCLQAHVDTTKHPIWKQAAKECEFHVKLRPTTRRGYHGVLERHVRPHFTGRKLVDIDFTDVEEFIADRLSAVTNPRGHVACDARIAALEAERDWHINALKETVDTGVGWKTRALAAESTRDAARSANRVIMAESEAMAKAWVRYKAALERIEANGDAHDAPIARAALEGA